MAPDLAMAPDVARRDALAELVHDVAGGSRRAFADLYDLTSGWMYRLALAELGHPARAESLLERAYLDIWVNAHRFRPAEGDAATWITSTTARHIVTALPESESA